ncbi:organic solute transporter Ostalpha-domain-containing protein [Gigaspora rosea]|uniref:Organic solute transporter Ostalpha-domain-containing protein n=1 Tax=Gigaspora rosea TaxID=44941 RepID=A0A397V506_9GLOM|nr:organic solute transporter Ostalpha-domain-containing protein [Gigaspora rosea]CAG8674144.1 22792_t:CDS:2 [Gigaspora rosea]
MSFNRSCPVHNKDETDPTKFWDDGLHWDAHRIGWTISGVFALVATLVSFYLIFKHLQNYNKPNHQRYIIRIILMVPIYAIISWLSYRYFRYSTYYETIRDCYEAFAIAAFFALLTQFVGESHEEQKKMLRTREKQSLPFPFCCFRYNPAKHKFLILVKWGILQYVIMKPIITLISLITEAFGVFCAESLSFAFARVYMKIITFICVTVAMYALVVFYLTIREDIKDEKPFLKFLCIKLVIFFSFWQSIVLAIIADLGIIKETQYWTSANVSGGLAAMLVCIEMAVFSVLHIIAFPYQRYEEDKKIPISKGLVDAFNPIDIWRELVYIWIYFKDKITGKQTPRAKSFMDIENAIKGDSTNGKQPSKANSDIESAYIRDDKDKTSEKVEK